MGRVKSVMGLRTFRVDWPVHFTKRKATLRPADCEDWGNALSMCRWVVGTALDGHPSPLRHVRRTDVVDVCGLDGRWAGRLYDSPFEFWDVAWAGGSPAPEDKPLQDLDAREAMISRAINVALQQQAFNAQQQQAGGLRIARQAPLGQGVWVHAPEAPPQAPADPGVALGYGEIGPDGQWRPVRNPG